MGNYILYLRAPENSDNNVGFTVGGSIGLGSNKGNNKVNAGITYGRLTENGKILMRLLG